MTFTQHKIEKILVRGTNWIGDAVMTLPALERLRGTFPQAHITLLATPRTVELFAGSPFVDEVIAYRRAERGVRAFLETVWLLRKRRFDLALLFQNAFEAALLTWLGGVRWRVGYAVQSREVLLTHHLPMSEGRRNRHQINNYVDLVLKCGLLWIYPEFKEKMHELEAETARLDLRVTAVSEVESPSTIEIMNIQARQAEVNARMATLRLQTKSLEWPETTPLPSFAVNAAQREAAATLLQRVGIAHGERPLIALNTAATNSRAKCWPEERFAMLADRFVETMNAQVVLIGAPSERENAEHVIAQMEHRGALNLAGETSLPELIGLLDVCEILVSNDTGPAHIAAALGRPTLTIFGPTNEFETAPTGKQAEIIRADGVHCARCMHRDCPIDHRCMTLISPYEVFAVAQKLLAKQ